MFSENLKTGIQTSYSQNCVETLPRHICRSMLSDITSEFGEATRHVLLTRKSSTYFVLYTDYPFISVRLKHWLVYCVYILWENSSRLFWGKDMLFQQGRVPPIYTHSKTGGNSWIESFCATPVHYQERVARKAITYSTKEHLGILQK
jgi:hypothetical protein